MRGIKRGARVLGGLSVALAAVAMASVPARGQSIGDGASPGRAAYRPSRQWNNGPYYTAPHIDPYAPHRAVATNLYAAEPLVDPWTTGPHGLYPTFFPAYGVLYPYAEGFSPYSGFSPWYARTYNVVPTRQVVQEARAAFFRSAPRPPDRYLPPLPPARPVTIAIPAAQPRAEEATSKIIEPVPTRPLPPLPPATTRVYRSSVAGGSSNRPGEK